MKTDYAFAYGERGRTFVHVVRAKSAVVAFDKLRYEILGQTSTLDWLTILEEKKVEKIELHDMVEFVNPFYFRVDGEPTNIDRGKVGTVVHIHDNSEAYEVEINNMVLTVPSEYIRKCNNE